MIAWSRPLAGLIVLLSSAPFAADQSNRFDDRASGMQGWSWQGDGLLLQQVQRRPEQVRTFLQGRGLEGVEVAALLRGCLFELLLSNTGDAELEVDLESWRVDAGAGPQPLAIGPLWRAHDRPEAGAAQRIDIQWSFFPLRQEFLPADWSSGLVVYPLAPGARFDLHFTWRAEGKARSGVLKGAVCAP
jgi:hypothetical protein